MAGIPSRAQPKSPKPATILTRNKSLQLVGAIIILASVLGAYLLYSSLTNTASVIEVTQSIPAGAIITKQDVIAVNLHVPAGLGAIPAAEAASLGTVTAAVTLVPGQLLTPNDLSVLHSVPAGDQIIGANLAVNHLPATGLEPNDVVYLWTTTTGSNSSTTPASGGSYAPQTVNPATFLGKATIYSLAGVATANAPAPAPNAAAGELVNILVTDAIAPPVVTAAAGSQLVITLKQYPSPPPIKSTTSTSFPKNPVKRKKG